MLIYHFGSREELMHEVLGGLRERADAEIQAWLRSGKHRRTLPEFLRWYWRQVGSPRARPAARVVFEVYALALRHPDRYPGVLTEPWAYWRKLTRSLGSRSRLDAATVTLLLATTRGLLLDVTATGERARVGRAMRRLISMVESMGRRRAAHAPSLVR
jgi:AcrR family transcriptional regulator